MGHSRSITSEASSYLYLRVHGSSLLYPDKVLPYWPSLMVCTSEKDLLWAASLARIIILAQAVDDIIVH